MGILSKERSAAVKELDYTTKSVPKDKRFCTICGEVKRLHYFEGDSTHCSACCEKMLHTKLNGKFVPVVLFTLLVAAFAIYLSIFTVPYCIDLFKAEEAVRDKRLADACTLYASAVSGASERNAALLSGGKKNPDGTYPQPSKNFFEAGARTWSNYLQTYAALYSEYEAATLAQGSLDKNESAKIPSIAGLSESLTAYEETLTFVESVESKYSAEERSETTYNKIIADLQAHADESDSRYVKAYTTLYMARATKFFKTDDLAASQAYYEKVLEYLPDEFMIVYSEEAEAAMQAEEYEAAVGIYEKIILKNKDAVSVYPAIANAAFCAGDEEKVASVLDRYDENDSLRLSMEMRFALREEDFAKADNVRARANEALKPRAEQIFNKLLSEQTLTKDEQTELVDYVEFAMWDAAYALVCDDIQTAFSIAYDTGFNYVYYISYILGDSSVFSQSIFNMTTLCAELAKDQDAIEMIGQIGPSDDTTDKIISGELTVRDVFVEGKAEIL